MRKFFMVFAGFLFCLSSNANAIEGVASIQPTKEDSAVTGNVILTETETGLKVSAQVSGATPGKHGFHIHENGACGEGGKAAGGHFNPDGMTHGFVTKEGIGHTHAGDFGNLDVNADGNGALEFVAPGLTLSGESKYNVLGKAFILHEKEDDFGQPTGNAGGRIACGVIELKK